MGYIKDEHIILECWNETPLTELRYKLLSEIKKRLKEWGDVPDYSNYVSPILQTIANTTYVVYVPADGSKEGWGTSQAMDDVREWLREYLIHWNATHDKRVGMITVTNDEGTGLSAEKTVRMYREDE